MPITSYTSRTSSSNSSKALGSGTAATYTGVNNSNANSLNNTLSKSMHNADTQPLDNQIKTTTKVTRKRNGLRSVKKNMTLSHLKDNRILNRGIKYKKGI